MGATSLGDQIYVCGGYDGVTSLNSVERYHPQTNSWVSLALMNKSRSAGAVIACQGNILSFLQTKLFFLIDVKTKLLITYLIMTFGC